MKRRTNNNQHRRKEYIKSHIYTVQREVANNISKLDVNIWVSTLDPEVKSCPATLSNGPLSVGHYRNETY
jgi:hypothetical protein